MIRLVSEQGEHTITRSARPRLSATFWMMKRGYWPELDLSVHELHPVRLTAA
jgi:hypothetical protein